MHEHEGISDMLIKHGALRVVENYTQREICDEASKGNLRIIKHMVSNGADVSYQDTDGRTAL
jgi:ankyrin repeat protein